MFASLTPEMFFVDRRNPHSLQMQLAESIVSTILNTAAQPGTKLPSTRQLAQSLGVSRITVILVYQDLVSRGYLDSAPRSGFVISRNVPHRRIQKAIEKTNISNVNWGDWLESDFEKRRKINKPHNWRRYPYPFIYGQMDPGLFDHNAWRDCARRALGGKEFTELADDSLTQDDSVLVEYIRRNTLPRRGIHVSADEILITLGAQNALWLIVQMLGRASQPCVMENPGFPDMAETLRYANVPIHYVPSTHEGLKPENIPCGTGLVFVTPSHSIPTGATMPLHARKKLLKKAEDQNFLIIEDDYEFEMSFLEPPSPSLKSLDQSGRVIYVGSFSKALFPGLRIGYLVADPHFIKQARALRAMILRHAPGHMQRVTGYFMALGHYDTHVVGLRKALRKRREALVNALAETDFTIAGAARHGGSSIWVSAPDGVESSVLAQSALKKGVLIEPGNPFFSQPNNSCRFFRMGYSSIDDKKIPMGVSLLQMCL